MAYSRVYYSADGSITDFAFGFPYLEKTHIKVYLNGEVVTNWSFLTDNTIRFTSAPTGIVMIRRSTSANSRLVDYTAPSSLQESDLDRDSLQAFYLCQEALDTVNSTISEDVSTGQFSAGGRRITNVADPVGPTDAVTKSYLEDNFLASVGQAVAAATIAETMADTAADARDVAMDAAADADEARIVSQATLAATETARDEAVAAAASVDVTPLLRKDDNLNSLTDKAAARANLGVPAALGFTPVEQGGGAGQNTSKVKLGGAAGGGAKIEVGGIDLGKLLTTASMGEVVTNPGKFSLGNIQIKFGRKTGAGSAGTITYDAAFPNATLGVFFCPLTSSGVAATTLNGTPSAASFTYFSSVMIVSVAASNHEFFWLAIGY